MWLVDNYSTRNGEEPIIYYIAGYVETRDDEMVEEEKKTLLLIVIRGLKTIHWQNTLFPFKSLSIMLKRNIEFIT